MKIVAFGGSNSKNSMNKQLAAYTADLFENAEVELLDLNDYEMPLFGVDLEALIGKQDKAGKFLSKLSEGDLIIISLAEHTGSYSVAFKNILDWASRIDKKVFQNKPVLLMAASNGARGGLSVLEAAQKRFPYMGANIAAVFSLPNFYKNFDSAHGILNVDLNNQLNRIVAELQLQLSMPVSSLQE